MKFKYWARTKEGKIQTGIIEASSREAALEILKSSQLYVTGLEAAEAVPVWRKEIKLFERVAAVDLIMLSRQLAVMFQSGVPLSEALGAIAGQTKKTKFREKILKIAQDIEGGTSLSKALGRFPELFSSFYVAVVKAGEVSGTLSRSLNYLADHLAREHKLASQIRGAMLYPALVIMVMMGIFVLMTVFVIPQLVDVITGAGVEPPTLTKASIALSNFLRTKWWLLLLTLIGLGVGFVQYRKTPEGKKTIDKILIRFPWIGGFLKKLYLARFAENLSTLITGGLPIAQALEVSGDIVGNWVYQQIIFEAKDKVVKGGSISGVFSEYPETFTPLFIQMSLVGEKTGHIDKTLQTVANFYEEEINRTTENLVSILEPILIVILGGGVGLLVASVILPMYQISTSMM